MGANPDTINMAIRFFKEKYHDFKTLKTFADTEKKLEAIYSTIMDDYKEYLLNNSQEVKYHQAGGTKRKLSPNIYNFLNQNVSHTEQYDEPLGKIPKCSEL